MTRKLLLGIVGVAVILLGWSPSQARVRKVTHRYEVSSMSVTEKAEDPVGITSDGWIEYGGVYFPPVAKKGRFSPTLNARDDFDPYGTGLVYISACQDVDEDGLCNSSNGDIRAAGCVGKGEPIVLPRARKDLPIGVFVYAVNGCPSLESDWAGATTGTVTLRWGR